MTAQKNALVLFSKPPVPGLVKTRLSTIHDGSFSPVQAATLYRRMMLDVLECCMQALDRLEEQNRIERENDPSIPEQTYEMFISTTSPDCIAKMEKVLAEAGELPRSVQLIEDKGKIFDDHFDDAFQQVFNLGFGTCVALGGDIPIMPRNHVVEAFNHLHNFQKLYPEGGIVLAPCQASGTSLVGYTPECGMDNQSVYYNLNGRPALQAYLDKGQELGAHIALLGTVPDVDTMDDLAHVVTVINALEYVAKDQDIFLPHRTLDFIRVMKLEVTTPPNRNFDSREEIDI